MNHEARVYRQELTPIHFIERAGEAYAERIAAVDGDTTYDWRQFRSRARRFASALQKQGLARDDRVAFLAFNTEPLLLAHFGVPMARGVLVAINTRWSAQEIAYVIGHCGARWVFFSPELAAQLEQVPSSVRRVELGEAFEALLASGDDVPPDLTDLREDDSISINYTSGTTGKPKGVVYHHRGAYLNAVAMALDHRLTADSQYLWTLPMFHCNGWTFPWALAAVGARSICISRIDPLPAWKSFDTGVTHFCAAPTVLIMLANDAAAHRLNKPVRIFTAGAPPSPTLIARMAELNFELDHVYGLTETYGPYTINIPSPRAEVSAEARAKLRARQGFSNLLAGETRVVDDRMQEVPRDGETLGEVVMRGNVVMKGYFDDPEATARAFEGGWFHSGDLAVVHADGAIELRDRKKDIIISGGENISTIEVEQAVASHPAVMECAVIAVPHAKWGEVPKAFVVLKPGCTATSTEIIEHCRAHLARFKVPHSVEFGALPKTSTGKIQKFVLREREWRGHDKRIN